MNIQYYNKIACYNKIIYCYYKKHKLTQASERRKGSQIVLAGEETQKIVIFQCKIHVIGGMGVVSEIFFFFF